MEALSPWTSAIKRTSPTTVRQQSTTHIDFTEGERLPKQAKSRSDNPQDINLRDGRLEFRGSRAMLMDVAGSLYAIKRTLRTDTGFYEKEFMFRAGLEGAREYLAGLVQTKLSQDPNEAIREILTTYSERGYGEFRVESIDPKKKTAEITSSNSAEAWAFQTHNDIQREPVCSYTSGMLAWACRTALAEDLPADSDIRAVETECVASGSKLCRFIVAPYEQLPNLVPRYDLPKDFVSEQVLRINEEILVKNLELQSLNLSLERQVRKRTEELRRSEENHRYLVNLSPDPIIICSPEGAISSVNESGLRMLGFDSVDDAVNVKMQSMLVGGEVAWNKLVWFLEKEGQAFRLEMGMLRRDGTKLTAEISARFAELPRGRFVEAILRDVTEKRLMQAQVLEARFESDFLNDLMSHDITNYMMSALHFASNLRKSTNLTDEEKRQLSVLMKDIEGAFELSTSVRDMSRMRMMDEIESGIYDLHRILREAAEEAKGMYSEKRVILNLKQPTEPWYVRGKGIMPKLFMNLFTNAIKYDPNEEVVIDIQVENIVEKGQLYWLVRVVDHGKGIPDEEKEKVFEKFHRLDTSVPGTGLGLFVTRFIARSCGGKVWAENTVKGEPTKGTTMVVQLPKADVRQVAESRRPPK